MTEGWSGAAKLTITQRELEDFLALKGQLEALKRRFALERERLLWLVDGHASVEPGRLQVEVQESAQQMVTKAFLVSVLGEEGYQDMRAEAPPTVYQRLVVRERGWGRTQSPMEQVRARTWPSFVRGDQP